MTNLRRFVLYMTRESVSYLEVGAMVVLAPYATRGVWQFAVCLVLFVLISVLNQILNQSLSAEGRDEEKSRD